MGKVSRVNRPLRKSEFEIRFASNSAKKGWNDLLATTRNPLVTVWERLTSEPLEASESVYRLRDSLSLVTYQGKEYERWQIKPTLKGSARIWYFVDEQLGVVYLERVYTAHPHQTK